MSSVFFPIRISAVLIALFVGVVSYQYQSFRGSLDERYLLAMQVNSGISGNLVVYFNHGNGYNDAERSEEVAVSEGSSVVSIAVPLKNGIYESFRVHPVESGTGVVTLQNINIVDGTGRVVSDLLEKSQVSVANVKAFAHQAEKLTLELDNSRNPQLNLLPDEEIKIRVSSDNGFNYTGFLLVFVSLLLALITWIFLQVVLSSDRVCTVMSRMKSDTYWNKRLPWILFWVVLGHRMIILLLHADYLGGYIAQNVNALTLQYLTIDNISDHPWLSLLYLHQAPPIPQFLLTLVVANWGWGVESHFVLIWIQSLLSAITAMLMFRVMCLFGRRHLLFAIVTLIFAFSPDLVVMETNWLGQTIYENLCMVWLLLMVLQFKKFFSERKLSNALLLGLWLGLLALTKASFSLLFVLASALIMLSKLKDKRVWVYGLMFLAGWAPLQIGWALKNSLVYSYFNLSNSSWAGYSLLEGFHEVDLLEELLETARRHESELPLIFSTMYGENSELLMWDELWSLRGELPDRVNEIDRQIIEKLEGSFRYGNTLAGKVFGDIYTEAYFAAIKANPGLFWKKIEVSWTGFWRPIRECAYLFVAPYYTEPLIPNMLDMKNVAGQFMRFDADRVYRYDSGSPLGYREVMLLTVPLLPRIFWLWNTVVFVFLLVATPIWSIWLLVRRKPLSTLFLTLILMLGVVIYLALLTTVVAAGGEHCRDRIPVDPVLWALGAISFGWCSDFFAKGRPKGVE